MTGKPRGFAAISPERRAEISRKGGIAAHAKGTAHEYTSEEAREAGRKGGLASGRSRRAKLDEPTPYVPTRVADDGCDPSYDEE